MRSERKVKLYGRIKNQTTAAVLFRVTVGQDADVPRAAIGRSLWFPKSWVNWYVDRQGREVLSLRASRLKKKLAQASPSAQPESVTVEGWFPHD